MAADPSDSAFTFISLKPCCVFLLCSIRAEWRKQAEIIGSWVSEAITTLKQKDCFVRFGIGANTAMSNDQRIARETDSGHLPKGVPDGENRNI